MQTIKEVFFEIGVLYGRIRQLCLEKGVVHIEEGLALSDYVDSFVYALDFVLIDKERKEKIKRDVEQLKNIFLKYQPSEKLTEDDASVVISITNRWKDLLLQNSYGGTDVMENERIKSYEDILKEKEKKINQKFDEIRKINFEMARLENTIAIKDFVTNLLDSKIREIEKTLLERIKTRNTQITNIDNLEEFQKSLSKISDEFSDILEFLSGLKNITSVLESYFEGEIEKILKSSK